MWLQSYKTYFKTLRKVPKKLRFRRVLRSLSTVFVILNHPKSHATLLTDTAFLVLHHFPVSTFVRADAADYSLGLKILEVLGYSTHI